MITAHLISKEEMLDTFGAPYYGYTSFPRVGEPIVFVRNDLPAHLTNFVTAHEMYHANDKTFADSSMLGREMRANWAGIQADWRGFVQMMWWTLTDWERIKLNAKRLFGGY